MLSKSRKPNFLYHFQAFLQTNVVTFCQFVWKLLISAVVVIVIWQFLWQICSSLGSILLLTMLYCRKRFTRAGNFQFRINVKCEILFLGILESPYYRTRVRSLAMLVTHWLTNSLTHSVTFPIIGYACQWLPNSLTNSLLFSKLDWCDPGMWRWQLKTCCYCLAMLVTHWLTDSLTHWLV